MEVLPGSTEPSIWITGSWGFGRESTLGRLSGAISLSKVAGRHRDYVEEAEMPAKDFSEFVNNPTAGWKQAQKVQNATDLGKSPG